MRRERNVIERAACERSSVCVATRMEFAASPERVWEELTLYEQIAERPPLYLRLLLPRPIRALGDVSKIGDDTKCLYENGHLLKRVSQLEPGRHFTFEVVEQELEVGGGIRLLGGGYRLRELPGGATEVVIETRYFSPKNPRWVWKRIEAAVCHAFHLHILGAMRLGIGSTERRARRPAARPAASEPAEHPEWGDARP